MIMYYWEEEIDRERKAEKKRWNGKVIITGRQWAENADGAREPAEYNLSDIWAAVNDYRMSRSWN